MLEDFEIKSTVKTNLEYIDSVVGGSFNPSLHTFAGVAGVGKSALLLQIGHESEHPTLYLNSDMHINDLNKRLVCISNSDVKLNDVAKQPKDVLSAMLQNTRSSNTHLELLDTKAGFYSLNLLKTKIKDIAENQNPDTILVIIDSFNAWIDTAKIQSDKTKEDIVAESITELLDIIQEHGVTVLVSAQETNEAANDYVNKALLAASDTYIRLSWARNGRPDSEGFRQSSTFFEKNRNGISGVTKIGKFKGEYQKFSD